MMANQKSLDIISNNLLNVQTAGYRAEKSVLSAFEQEMVTAIESSGNTVLGDGVGAQITTIKGNNTLFQEGEIQATGRNLDVAISGEGFFSVTGEDGKTYLTRNGGFDLDTEGYLVLPGVGRVLGKSGYIKAAGTDIEITADGTVKSSSGTVLGNILVSSPSDYSTLQRTENGLFTSEETVPASTKFQLYQKSLEKSNVSMNVELTNLIAAQRSFQGCSSALETVDAINRKAAQQLAAI